MEPTEYFHPASKNNLVRIFQNPRTANLWCISLNGEILAENFTSPEDAADHAHRRDFPTKAAIDKFRHIKPPWDIKLWLTQRPWFNEPADFTNN